MTANEQGYGFRQSGVAIVMVVIVMAVVAATILGVSAVGLTETRMASLQHDGIAAQYLAEAGAKHAVVKYSLDRSFFCETQSFPDLGETACYYVRVGIDPNTPGNQIVTSVGRVGRAVKKVVLNVTLPQVRAPDGAAYRKVLFSDGILSLQSETKVNGDLHANAAEPVVNGALINGNVSGPPEHLQFPAVNAADYKKIATTLEPGTCHLTSRQSRTITNETLWYIEGDLYLDPGSLLVIGDGGKATVFVNGDFHADTANLPSNLLLIAAGNIFLDSTGFWNDICIAGQSIIVHGANFYDTNLRGILLARQNITVTGRATFTFTDVLASNPPPGLPATGNVPFSLNTWSH